MNPYILVFGNEKGGTGKSTLAVHVTVDLLHRGYRVASCDLDGRQGTFSRYMENRQSSGCDVPCPHYTRFLGQNSQDFVSWMKDCQDYDVLVVDTPGHSSDLSTFAHTWANLLVTPMNESHIDLDLLATLDRDHSVQGPSVYANMVWEQRKERMVQKKPAMDWLVALNRTSRTRSKNRTHVTQALEKLSQRFGFSAVSGLGERVIFRQLFLEGLTLSDLPFVEKSLSVTAVAARQDLRLLMKKVLGFMKKT